MHLLFEPNDEIFSFFPRLIKLHDEILFFYTHTRNPIIKYYDFWYVMVEIEMQWNDNELCWIIIVNKLLLTEVDSGLAFSASNENYLNFNFLIFLFVFFMEWLIHSVYDGFCVDSTVFFLFVYSLNFIFRWTVCSSKCKDVKKL